MEIKVGPVAPVAAPLPLETDRAQDALAWTRRILDACGPRPAGSPACLKAAELIAADLRKLCDRVEIQPFQCHPHAFVWHVALVAPLILVASALLVLGHLPWGAALLVAVFGISLMEFGLYRELVDGLFPRRNCANVIGVLEPAGPARRQVVLSAHHDSAYEFRFLRHSRVAYLVAMAWVGLTVNLVPLAAVVLTALRWLAVSVPSAAGLGLGLFAGLGALVSLFLISPSAVPGAGDNLISTGVLVTVAGMLRTRLKTEPGFLDGTRVILASFDAEESGLRGARAFVREHRAQLQSVPTWNLDLESFFHLDSLGALVSDLNGTVPLSKTMVSMLEEEARALGVPMVRRRMYYGLGATDAAEFARAGIPATCLVGMSPDPLHPKPLPYHTQRDTPDSLEPEVIAAAIELSVRMILRLGREPGDPMAAARDRR